MGVEKLARRQDSIPACALRDSRGMVTNRTGSSHQARGPGGSASRSDRGASVFIPKAIDVTLRSFRQFLSQGAPGPVAGGFRPRKL